jgi:ABC-type molybdate transport system ATPase subunit
MRLRAEKNKLKIEHSIIDGLRPVLERLLRDNESIRSIIPGVIRQVRDAKGAVVIRITVPTTNGWKAIALSAGARQELFVSTGAGKDELAAMIKAALDNS